MTCRRSCAPGAGWSAEPGGPRPRLRRCLAFAFAFTNGVHDASNAIATLVATRAASPGQAALLGAGCNLLGPLIAGAAVADTIGGFVAVGSSAAVGVIAAGLAAAVAWNGLTWALGLPSSSGHALIGGLVGAALLEAVPHAVRWAPLISGGQWTASGLLAFGHGAGWRRC